MDHRSQITAALVAVFFLLLGGPASAQIQYSGNTGKVVPPALNTMQGTADFERFMRNVTGTQLDLVDRTNGKIGGKTFPVDLTRGLKKEAAIRAAAQGAKFLAKRTLQGLVIAAAAEAAWCKFDTGSWVCDPRQPMVPVVAYTCMPNGLESRKQSGASALAACQAVAANLTSTNYNSQTGGNCKTVNSYVAVANGSGGYFFRRSYSYQQVITTGGSCPSAVFTEDWAGAVIGTQTTNLCPAVPGATNPAYQSPGGPAGPDGKCPTGTTQPATETEVQTKLAPAVDTPDKLQGVTKDMLDAGVDLTPYAEPAKVTGPASVTQTPTTTTTTSPNGTPQTTTTTVTNNITYEGDHFTWNNTTIVNKPDGSSETTTEEPEPTKTDCEKDPTLISCQKPDVPNAPDMPEKKVDVTWAKDGGWGAETGQCPANRTINFMGRPFEVDMQLWCFFFAGIRFAVIGAASILAVLIVIGGIKE